MPQRRNYPFYQIVLMCALALGSSGRSAAFLMTRTVPQSHGAALAVRGNLLSLRAKDFQNLYTFLWTNDNTIRFCRDQHGAADSGRH